MKTEVTKDRLKENFYPSKNFYREGLDGAIVDYAEIEIDPKGIKKLEDKVTEIQETFNNFKEKMFNFCDKICRALGHKIGLHFSKNYDIDYNEMEYYAQEVNHKYERSEKDKSDDFEIGM